MASNEEVVRQAFVRVFNGHDLSAIDELYAEGYAHDGPVPPGRAGFASFMAELLDAFPDLHGEILDVIASGDRVVCRSVFTGTHQGPIMGIEPTGRQVEYGVIEIFRLEDGRIAEHWQQTDTLALLTQLGLLPDLEAAVDG